MYVTKLLN